jgi:L-alanine-DL-glutamate epimerase-like enolase superfamily enzyme
MKITKISATPLRVPITIDVLGLNRVVHFKICLVEIETTSGCVGFGMTGITNEEVVAAAINKVVAPELVGDDPMATEKIWEKLYWLLSPRGQTGYAAHAIAAIDVALWDIKGKVYKEPVWRLLGGARERVPVYATFGFPFFEREQLGEAAKLWVERGFTGLKMTVSDGAIRNKNMRTLDEVLAEDIQRVRTVREAIGPQIKLYIDANCNLDPFHAIKLAKALEPYEIAFFEEPITQNDVRQLAEMRRQTRIPLACGQNEGLAYRFRDLMVANSVDIIQPNVVISGGFTQCIRIAGMAQAFNVGIDNGGAWPHFNMHLHAGLAHGGMVEMHYLSVECCRQVFDGLPDPEGGWLTLPKKPGLGFEINQDAVKEFAY